MKKAIYAAVAATMVAGSAFAHPVNEPHVCGVDPASLTEWPGYGTRGNIYDRGDYFFAVEVENFDTPIAYKHWNKVEAITNHVRIYKDDCRVSNIEIVHPESKDEVEEVVAVRWSLSMEVGVRNTRDIYFSNNAGVRVLLGNISYDTSPRSDYSEISAMIVALDNADQSIHDGATNVGPQDDPDYVQAVFRYFGQNINQR